MLTESVIQASHGGVRTSLSLASWNDYLIYTSEENLPSGCISMGLCSIGRIFDLCYTNCQTLIGANKYSSTKDRASGPCEVVLELSVEASRMLYLILCRICSWNFAMLGREMIVIGVCWNGVTNVRFALIWTRMTAIWFTLISSASSVYISERSRIEVNFLFGVLPIHRPWWERTSTLAHRNRYSEVVLEFSHGVSSVLFSILCGISFCSDTRYATEKIYLRNVIRIQVTYGQLALFLTFFCMTAF